MLSSTAVASALAQYFHVALVVPFDQDTLTMTERRLFERLKFILEDGERGELEMELDDGLQEEEVVDDDWEPDDEEEEEGGLPRPGSRLAGVPKNQVSYR